MNLPEYLSELQAARVRAIQAVLKDNLKAGEAAQAIGMRASNLSYVLKSLTGNGHWPADPAVIDALMALPVLDEAEVRRRRGKMSAEAHCRGRLRDHEIHARREAAARGHEDRERFWLAQEQARYGLRRQGMPLSRMPA